MIPSTTQIDNAHVPANTASRRVLEKIGMTFIRHVPEAYQKNDRWFAEDQ